MLILCDFLLFYHISYDVIQYYLVLYDLSCIVLSWGGSAPPTPPQPPRPPQLVGLRPPRTVGQSVGRSVGQSDGRI
jgi:hypothetical protein